MIKQRLFDKIKETYRFIKTRWILRQLRRDCFNASKHDMTLLLSGQTWMKRPIFVDFNAENGFRRKKRSDKKRREMVDELNSIINYCKDNNLITSLPAGTDMGNGVVAPCEMIKTTGDGDEVADKWNTCVDFLDTNKTILAVIWTIIGLVWVYLLREVVQNILVWIANIINKIIELKLWNG